MKKRIITLLAVLALLVVCAAISVSAANTPQSYYQSADWTCPGCGKTGDQLTFYTWGDKNYETAGNPGGQYGLAVNTDGENCNHYFMGAASTSSSTRGISGTGKVTIVLTNATGSAITHSTYATKGIKFMTVGAGSEVYLVGNNATIKSSMTAAEAGGVINVAAGGALHLSGSLTIKCRDDATTQPSTGGLLYNAGTVTMDGVTLDATIDRDTPIITGSGGAISNQGTMTITNSTIIGGALDTAKGKGGAIYSDKTLTVIDSTITGASSYQGGAIAGSGTITLIDTTVNGAYAKHRGGAIFSSATLNIGGDSVINAYTGTDGEYPGIMVAGGTCTLYGNTMVNGNSKELGGGVGATAGTVRFTDAATVQNEKGTWKNNIWRWSGGSAKLQFSNTWTGTASIDPGANIGGSQHPDHGGAVSNLAYGTVTKTETDGNPVPTFTFANGTSGSMIKIKLYSEDSTHKNVQFFGFQQYLLACRYAMYENGQLVSWWPRINEAVTAYGKSTVADKYLQSWSKGSAYTLKSEINLDLNGRDLTTITIGTGGKIHAFDSTAKAGEVAASSINAAEPITQINGMTYVFNGGKIYPVELKVNGVSLRPSATQASMYYSAKIVAHQDAGIDSFGMAVALNDSNVLEEHLYTAETDTTKLNAFNSVLVNGVVKNDATDNDARAAQKVYAKAYIKVGNTVVMSAAADYSLNSLASAIAKDPQYADRLTEIAAYDWYSALVIEE